MESEQLPPPEHDEAPDAEVEAMLALANRAGDSWLMPSAERDPFMAGYFAGRATDYDDGHAAGYAACDAEIARLQWAAVAATRRGEAWPSMNPDNYRDGLDPAAIADEEKP